MKKKKNDEVKKRDPFSGYEKIGVNNDEEFYQRFKEGEVKEKNLREKNIDNDKGDDYEHDGGFDLLHGDHHEEIYSNKNKNGNSNKNHNFGNNNNNFGNHDDFDLLHGDHNNNNNHNKNHNNHHEDEFDLFNSTKNIENSQNTKKPLKTQKKQNHENFDLLNHEIKSPDHNKTQKKKKSTTTNNFFDLEIPQQTQNQTTRKNQKTSQMIKMRSQNYYEPKIREWAYSNNIRKDIRTLLTSIDKFLWPGFGWKKIDLSEILGESQLKRMVFKALKVFHPDRNRDLDSGKLYLFERLVSEVNNGYKDYKSKRNGF